MGAGESGLQEVWRHQLWVPGRRQIVDEHYPDHPRGRGPCSLGCGRRREDERVFLAFGEGAERWLQAAAASGAARVRAKMAQATRALLFGGQQVDEGLRRAADAGRFGEDDLVSIPQPADPGTPRGARRRDLLGAAGDERLGGLRSPCQLSSSSPPASSAGPVDEGPRGAAAAGRTRRPAQADAAPLLL